MTITELIARIGPENIQVQQLNNAIVGADYRRKQKATEIRFLTNAFSCADLVLENGKVGIILWVNRDDLKRAELPPI